MYIIDNNAVVALDATTGTMLWKSPDTAGGGRGLVYWQSSDGREQRILTTADNHLIALDATTGAIIKTFGTDGKVDLREHLDRDVDSIARIQSGTPGRIFGDLLIVGSSPGEGYESPPGDIRAYDVRTGRMAWIFHTIPRPGEKGYETWPEGAWKKAGGANVWGEMTVDTKNGIVFAPTGAPTFDFYGGDRLGDNLYGTCLLALDARTGKLLWYFQAVHHDLWDYDNVEGPKLLTLNRDGKKVEAVVLAGKTGFLYVFERLTGKPVFPIEERPVPASDLPGEVAAKTQPFSTLPPFARQTLNATELSPLLDDEERAAYTKLISEARNEGIFTPPSTRGTVQMPGNHGGGQYGNGAIDPRTGRMFIASVEHAAVLKLEKQPPAFNAPMVNIGPQGAYATNCAMCHGADAKGQSPVPALMGIGKILSYDEFKTTVTKGRNQMPAFTNFTEPQLKALYDHLTNLVEFPRFPPDRPTRSSAAPAGRPGVEPDAHSLGNTEETDEQTKSKRYFSGYNFLTDQKGRPAISPPWAVLSAYDLNSGTVLWRKPYGNLLDSDETGLVNSGSLYSKGSLVATAGGLLFSATSDRKLRAWDMATGNVVWETTLPANPQAIPAVYSVKGRQYIAVMAGFSGLNFPGLPQTKKPFKNGVITYALPANLGKAR
jgi:quinoprotein glucose dehydrogenase